LTAARYFHTVQNVKAKNAVTALAALAQHTRLAVYRLLVQQGPSGMAAGEIAAALGLPPATLSFHLKELAHAGLVRARQDGRFVFYSADFAAMNALLGYLSENCCAADAGPDTGCKSAAVCAPVKPARRVRKRRRTLQAA
jgi:DNA-binding transcriptional ArsR family regulator